MNDIMFRVVLGHLVGDYLLQSKKMALTKSEKSLVGQLYCLVHSLIYTACVCLFAWNFTPLFAALILFSHWPIDRYSIGSIWLRLIRGRDLVQAFESQDKYREYDIAFTAIVYTVVDNTLHIILMWLIVKLVA